jgi:hypothetical protein
MLDAERYVDLDVRSFAPPKQDDASRSARA